MRRTSIRDVRARAASMLCVHAPEHPRNTMHANHMKTLPALLACSFFPLLAAAEEPSEPQEANLQSVEVVGRRASGSYYTGEAAGTKTSLALQELPQAVRVMSRQSLDDLGALRMDDAFDYVGGVSRQNNFGGMWDNIAIRGLAGDANNGIAMLQNGFAANRGFNAPRDTANIERIEFLKGTSASLYGVGEPGGTLNIVTKRPRWRSAHAVEAYAGSYDMRRLAIDSTGPLSETFAYRLNGAFEDRDSFRDHVQTRRELIAPAFTWKLSDATRVEYGGELLRHRGTFDRGIVAIKGVLGAVPRERFLGEPADGDIVVTNSGHQLVLEHAFGQGWTARAAVSYKRGSMDGLSSDAQPNLEPDGRTLRRQYRFRDYRSEDITLQAELAGRMRLAGIEHELLLGVDAYRLDFDQRLLRVNPTAAQPYAIDVLAPTYGGPHPLLVPNSETEEEQRGRSFYVQDTLVLGERWRLLAGLRAERYRQVFANMRTRSATAQALSEVSPKLGLSYLAGPQWTLYANVGRSFRPNTGADADAASFEAEHGRASEAGVKWENAARNAGATLALFDIRKRNALTADPLHAGYSVAAGEVRSRGMDLDFSGQLTRSWRANASLSYIDAEVTRDNTLAVGEGLLNIPRSGASALVLYDGSAGGRRYGLGAGVSYAARRLGEVRTAAQAAGGKTAFELPAYTTAKLVAYWELAPRLRLSLDVDNLFDRTYYTSSSQATWVSPGAARSIVLGLQAKY